LFSARDEYVRKILNVLLALALWTLRMSGGVITDPRQ